MPTLRFVLPAALAATLVSCDRAKPMAVNPDPKQNTYASELGVSLDSMRLERGGLYVRDVTTGTGPAATPGTSIVTLPPAPVALGSTAPAVVPWPAKPPTGV